MKTNFLFFWLLVIFDGHSQSILKDRFPAPNGFEWEQAHPTSFGHYLQHLPLKPEGSLVRYYNGRQKPPYAYHAVVDMDIGTRDLQQCADAGMRLKAEYLYEQKRFEDIHFNFVRDGKPRYFLDYSKGNRDYLSLRSYLNYVFAYANTSSLYDELQKVENIKDLKAGDVFIQKGKPFGHAVLVLGVALNQKTGEKAFILGQSFMPAQETQVLKNPLDSGRSPWYILQESQQLIQTPEWEFTKNDLRRFVDL